MKTKSHLLILFLAFLGMSVQAQEGEIIYRDLNPDSILTITNCDTMLIDLDWEGHSDIIMDYYTLSVGVYPEITSIYHDSIQLCVADEGVIISEVTEWHNTLDSWIVRENHHYGFRIKRENDYLYGWFETYLRRSESNPSIVYWGFDRTAYCTIPNYPLVWGQTDITGVEENSEKAFATIHPNPASSSITITGENLRQIEITNMLGQRVASHQAEGPQTSIDISSLPTGIYLATITDENGKRCVQKVVKE